MNEIEYIIDEISSVSEIIYDYIVNTEHWLFYWITNKEVQDFIEEHPEDYEDRVNLSVVNLAACPTFKIQFDEHPYDVGSITRYAALATFRDSVNARWLEWKGKVKELRIKEKEHELEYYKNKVITTEKELEELKKVKNYDTKK